jgi:type I restriction enzyme M protein
MIVGAFRDETEISGFSRLISLEEIAANDHILSIRRYVDSPSLSPSFPDVMAVLSGGIPKSEVLPNCERFRAYGIEIEDLFRKKDARYYDFLEEGWEHTAARIPKLAALRKEDLLRRCSLWWESVAPSLVRLSADGKLLGQRQRLAADFTKALRIAGVLDQHRLAGVFAIWWSGHKDDLRRPDFSAETVGDGLRETLAQQMDVELQQLGSLYRFWGERYGTSLSDLDTLRTAGAAELERRLNELGFLWP